MNRLEMTGNRALFAVCSVVCARDVFSWESIGDKTVEVYQSVLDEQKK